MVGYIAYSLYKAEKVAHIEKHKDDPDIDLDDLINKFTESKDNQTSLKYYRAMAETTLENFMGETVDEMYEQLFDDIETDLTAHIDEIVAPAIIEKVKGEITGHIDEKVAPLISKNVKGDIAGHIDEKVAPVISDKISSDLTSQIDSKIVPVISQKEKIGTKLKWGICSSLVAAILAPIVWLIIEGMVKIHKDNPEQRVYDRINQSIIPSQSSTDQPTANFPDSITPKQAD